MRKLTFKQTSHLSVAVQHAGFGPMIGELYLADEEFEFGPVPTVGRLSFTAKDLREIADKLDELNAPEQTTGMDLPKVEAACRSVSEPPAVNPNAGIAQVAPLGRWT